MAKEYQNGAREPLSRIYGSLRYFVGENRLYPAGDKLYVSSKNNDNYDVILTADGKSKFLQLWADKDKQPSGGGLGPNTVGSQEIVDGSIQTEDLSDDVKDKMHHSYDEENEGIRLGGM